MKVSRLFFLFVLSGLFSTGIIIDNANAMEVDHYYEENTVCATTTTSVQPIVVTDGTDFEFEDGSDYLIILTSTWGGDDNALTYEINVQHGTTIFEGSQQIIEPKQTNQGCSANKDHYKYFFWTVWSPVGVTEAGEDISLNYISTDLTEMLYDDVTIFVMDLNDINPLDWLFVEDTTDEPLSDNDSVSLWNTNSSASVSISSMEGDDWAIFGNAVLSVDDVATNYETRLNFGNESFTPLVSKEGEDTGEQLVASFTRVFTLNSTQMHDFTIESRNDGSPVGTNERLYNSIFALNLNTFGNHNATYFESTILLGDDAGGDYNTELGSITLPALPTNNSTNWYIFGEAQYDEDKKKGIRLQVDNVDQPADQTTQSYDFSDGWDNSDRMQNSIGTLELLSNSTHTVDLDGHSADGSKNAREISIFAFTLEPSSAVAEIMTMNDTATMVFGVTLNATDTMRMTEIVNGTGAWVGNTTSGMNMTDTTNGIFSVFGNITSGMNMTDIVDIGGFGTFGNITSGMNMTDEPTLIFGVTLNATETMTLTDAINGLGAWLGNVLDFFNMNDTATSQGGLFGSVNDTMVQTDNSTIIFSILGNVTETQSMSDALNGLGAWLGDGSETMLMFDNSSSIIQLFGNATDVMTMNDTSAMSIFMSQNVTDGMNMTEIVNGGFDAIRLVNSTMILTDTINGVSAFGSGIILDVMIFLDGAGFGFNEEDPPVVVIPPSTGGSGTGGSGTGLPVQNPDSDGDGILDINDLCPLEPEDFDGFEDTDGCPEGTPLTLPDGLTIDDITDLIPFQFNQLDVVDDNVILDTISPQPQVEDLTIRWLGTDPLEITSIVIGDSPFEIQIGDIPEFIGSSGYGLTEHNILYTIQEPFKICVNQFTFDCVDTVTYSIPVVVTGKIGAEIIQSEGRIIIDNTDRISYWWLIVIGIGIVSLIFVLLYKKRRKAVKPKTKTLLTIKRSNVLGQQTVTVNVKPQKSTKSGTTRKLFDTKPTYHTKEPTKKSLKKINKKKKSKGGKMSNIFGRK